MIGDLLNQRIVQLQLDQVGIYLFIFFLCVVLVRLVSPLPHLNCKIVCVFVSSESGAVPSHCHAHGEHVVSPGEETHSATK